MAEPFDMNQLFRQIQELGGKMKTVQETLRHRTAEATVGGGMVRAVVNGKLELVSIEIDPQAVDARDVEMLQDLVVAAVNEAHRRAQALVQEELQQATGLPLGALGGLLGGTQ
ncbi:MAG: YbaB/EbfC family nucleoid-associated protein [Myxococcales bacterium]|nr:YbaB/EbfC family nucleoid-associated protein [Myxococcales bacterium]